ncbi:MAG TPA: hypothetical protein VJ783_19410 [Pirellulales bacterium]|nr:hypothetical protein [Pirellulales bacterium]
MTEATGSEHPLPETALAEAALAKATLPKATLAETAPAAATAARLVLLAGAEVGRLSQTPGDPQRVQTQGG